MRKRFRIITLVLASIIAINILSFSSFAPSSVFAEPSSNGSESSSNAAGSNSSSGNSENTTEESSSSGGSASGSSQNGCSYLNGAASEAAGCEEGDDDVLANVIVNILLSIIVLGGVISAVYIVIGGIKFISSQGSPDMVQEGRKTLLYAAIGLVISSLAFVIVNFSIRLIYEDMSGSESSDSSSEEGEEGGEESMSGYTVDFEDFYARSPGIGTGSGDGAETSSGEDVTNVSMLSRKAMDVGDSEALIAHITPYRLTGTASITWDSDNPNVVSVDNRGNIVARNPGVARITATTKNGKTASTQITVTRPIEPASVTLEPNRITKLVSGKQFNLAATVYPREATNKHVTWSTDNAGVATVNSRGQVTGRKPGNANITARTANGKTATTSVTVIEAEGDVIKITPSLLSGLEYYYQTNHLSETNTNCGTDAGSSSCGPASYMAAVHVLTKQNINYLDFVNNACGKWYDGSGANVEMLANTFREEYKNRYHVDIKRIPNTWEAAVAELKKGHVVIFLVHSIPQSVIQQQGYRLTDHSHYVLAISYRNQGGGQIYIWSPVSEKAAPGRNIGDCSAGQCWYDRAAFQRNINEAAWTLWKV
jgi:uncharacterized protein YjdB